MAGIVSVFSEIKAEIDFLIIDLAAGISPWLNFTRRLSQKSDSRG